jgi:hypothetical protein
MAYHPPAAITTRSKELSNSLALVAHTAHPPAASSMQLLLVRVWRAISFALSCIDMQNNLQLTAYSQYPWIGMVPRIRTLELELGATKPVSHFHISASGVPLSDD